MRELLSTELDAVNGGLLGFDIAGAFSRAFESQQVPFGVAIVVGAYLKGFGPAAGAAVVAAWFVSDLYSHFNYQAFSSKPAIPKIVIPALSIS